MRHWIEIEIHEIPCKYASCTLHVDTASDFSTLHGAPQLLRWAKGGGGPTAESNFCCGLYLQQFHAHLEVEKKGIACQLQCILIQTTEGANVFGSIYSGLFTVWPLSGLWGETWCKHTCPPFIFQQLYSSNEPPLPQPQTTSLPLSNPHSVISAEIVTPRCFVELTKEWVPEWMGLTHTAQAEVNRETEQGDHEQIPAGCWKLASRWHPMWGWPALPSFSLLTRKNLQNNDSHLNRNWCPNGQQK